MEADTSLKLNVNDMHLKVVKKLLKGQFKRLYINTLLPNFSYKNQFGDISTTKKSALL